MFYGYGIVRTGNQKSKGKSQELGVRGQEPGIGNRELGVKRQESGVRRSQESGVKKSKIQKSSKLEIRN